MRILIFPAGAGVGGADEGAHVLTTTILGEAPNDYTRRGASHVVTLTILRERSGATDPFYPIRKLQVKVEQANRPTVVDPKDIVLETTGTTVCGSDLHLLASVVCPERPAPK